MDEIISTIIGLVILGIGMMIPFLLILKFIDDEKKEIKRRVGRAKAPGQLTFSSPYRKEKLNHKKNDEKIFYTIEDIAKILKLKKRTVLILILKGEIPSIQIEDKYLIPKSIFNILYREE